MTTQINWLEKVQALVETVEEARTEAIVTTALPLGFDDTIDGETESDRAFIVYDQYQGRLVYALLRSADDIDALLGYIQFAANTVRQEQADAGQAVVAPALPGALTAPGVSIQWSIHPDVYFAAQKQTL